MKTRKPKPGSLKPEPWTASVTIQTAVLSCTRPSKLSNGLWITVFTAVTRQCNVHRTVFRRKSFEQPEALALLRRWASQLPLEELK